MKHPSQARVRLLTTIENQQKQKQKRAIGKHRETAAHKLAGVTHPDARVCLLCGANTHQSQAISLLTDPNLAEASVSAEMECPHVHLCVCV